MTILRTALALLISAIAFAAVAAGGPVIRTRLAPATVVIGQPVTLAVDILVPTWFGGAIDYPPTIALPGTVAKLSDERPVNLNEHIGDASYAGMTKNYVIVPQQAGAFDVPAITIRVPYSVDGKTVETEVHTAPQHFEARLPAGAENLGYFIATRSYRLTQQVEPSKLASLKVGDALVRRITQRATDFAPMLLPALTFDAIDGLDLYPAEPILDEQGGERGAARIATRTDAVTYVLAKPGHYRLPGLRIGWFDPGTSAMRWAEAPELAFDVAPNPAALAAPAEEARSLPIKESRPSLLRQRWREAVVLAMSVVLTGGLAWWLVPLARRRIRDARVRRAGSEAVAFRRLRRALRAGEPTAMREALADWVVTMSPDDPRASRSDLVAAYGDSALAAQVAALDRQLYAERTADAPSWSPPALERGLIAMRTRFLHSRRRRAKHPADLQALNPLRVE
jgi:hypothetical protein